MLGLIESLKNNTISFPFLSIQLLMKRIKVGALLRNTVSKEGRGGTRRDTAGRLRDAPE